MYDLKDAALGLGFLGAFMAGGALVSYALRSPPSDGAPGVALGTVVGGASGLLIAAASPKYRAAGLTAALISTGYLAGTAALVAMKPKAT